jgi:hypothetical protein
VITPAQQRELCERHVDEALDRLEAFMRRHRGEIRRQMLLRVMSIGLADYGDRTWHAGDERLEGEAIAELADGAFYLTPVVARAAGSLVRRADGSCSVV